MRRPNLRVCLLAGILSQAAGFSQSPRDLTEISLEELMKIEVTSVSKKQQLLKEVPAAVFVITQEDIRRSGATSIAEALRMAPGVQVARISSGEYAITARGFNGRWSNKLLVLIDGRSVYHPLFSGVYWHLQDTLLEDIERIEVIRGPGGTVWGANAVNGVINIITRSASQTQGGLASGGGGSEEHGFAALGYGGRAGSRGHYRVYAKYFQRSGLEMGAGESIPGDWGMLRGGFRVDTPLGAGDTLTVLGGLYQGHTRWRLTEAYLLPPFQLQREDDRAPAGGNLVGRWRRARTQSETELQVSFDCSREDSLTLREAIRNLDLDFLHRRKVRARHELAVGWGYRLTDLALGNRLTFSFEPEHRHPSLFTGFLEDAIALRGDRLQLVLGSKFEHNRYSGFEIQPTARLLWAPSPRQAAWLAVSRAVRSPAPADQDLRWNAWAQPGLGGRAALVRLIGRPDFRSERLRAYEAGYRIRPLPSVSLDAASFYNSYRDLRDYAWGTPFAEVVPAPLHLVVPAYVGNLSQAKSWGLELAANWQPVPRWKLAGSYTGLALRIHRTGDPMYGALIHGDHPRHQASLRSALDLSHTVQADVAVYYVGALGIFGIPAYTRVDARLAWQPKPPLELSVAAANLLDPRHPEYLPAVGGPPAEIGRSLYVKVTWRF